MAHIYKLHFGADEEEEGEAPESQAIWRKDIFMLFIGVIIGIHATLTFVQH